MEIHPTALLTDLHSDLAAVLGPGRLEEILACSELWPDASFKEAACWSIAKSFLKKFKVANSAELDSKALLKFLHVNSRCKNWTLQLTSSWDETLVGEVRRALYDFFHVDGLPIGDNFWDCFHHGKTGPGASIGARGGDFYSKMFSSPLTCTRQSLYLAYRNYIRNFPEWSNAEIIRQEHYGSPIVVEGNRLSFVPKNDQISRTICVEPSLNMFAQLGYGHMIERRLLSAWGINLADQPFKNRELARIGSLGHGLVTIDLVSASDSMSLGMLEHFLPKHVFGMLKMLRSPSCQIPGLGQVELSMVSTMGNGFTFPLQTTLFSAIVLAAFRARGIKPRFPRGTDYGNWGVFGDDIICPTEVVQDVFRLLALLGFEVNKDKTFVEGPFRESCGADYFRGLNLRGVYVKSIQTQQDRVAVVNQLNLFSTRTGIPLPRTVQRLMRTIRYLPVPRWENDSSGVKVPLSLVQGKLPVSKDTGSILYRRYEPVGSKIRVLEGKVITPKGKKLLIYNPSGLLVSFLQRSINASTIGVRQDPVRYRQKLGVAPYWDATPTVHPLTGWFPWQRWNTAVYLNLYG